MKKPETLEGYIDAILRASTLELEAAVRNRPIKEVFNKISTHQVFDIARNLANRPAETWVEKVKVLYALDELLGPHYRKPKDVSKWPTF